VDCAVLSVANSIGQGQRQEQEQEQEQLLVVKLSDVQVEPLDGHLQIDAMAARSEEVKVQDTARTPGPGIPLDDIQR